jgi:hypothetical protein
MKKEVQDFNAIESGDDLSNISRVLRSARKVISGGNYNKLGDLSNEMVHSATVSQNSLNIIIAVLVYSLSKVLQKENYRKMEGWREFENLLLKNLDLMIAAAEKKDRENVILYAGEVRHILNTFSGNLGTYIKDIFRKAEINKAFKLYEHGLSVQKTAKLLGVSLWDLSSFIGQSKISEAKVAVTLPVRTRIKYIEEFFR